MFKEDTKYKFKSEKDFANFSDTGHANKIIAQAIAHAGGIFTVTKRSDEFYVIYVDDKRIITGNNVRPFLTEPESCFFEEAIKAVDTDESVDELREGLNFLQGLSSATGIQFTTAQAVNALDYILKNR